LNSAVLRRLVAGLLPLLPVFKPGPGQVGFVIRKAALRHVFSPSTSVFPVKNSIYSQNCSVSGLCPSSGILNTRKYLQKCCFLVFRTRTMDKARKSSNSECHTPSAEPFRFCHTDCSTLIITRSWHSRPLMALVVVSSVPLHPKIKKNTVCLKSWTVNAKTTEQ
jgi:hypothetical protein